MRWKKSTHRLGRRGKEFKFIHGKGRPRMGGVRPANEGVNRSRLDQGCPKRSPLPAAAGRRTMEKKETGQQDGKKKATILLGSFEKKNWGVLQAAKNPNNSQAGKKKKQKRKRFEPNPSAWRGARKGIKVRPKNQTIHEVKYIRRRGNNRKRYR